MNRISVVQGVGPRSQCRSTRPCVVPPDPPVVRRLGLSVSDLGPYPGRPPASRPNLPYRVGTSLVLTVSVPLRVELPSTP